VVTGLLVVHGATLHRDAMGPLMTEPARPEAALDLRGSPPWLLASIGAAALIMGFSWFGGLISWHDAISPPFDGTPALTLSTFNPHGTKDAHAVWILSDRALCIGPYSAATWTAIRTAALGATVLGSLIAFHVVLRRLARCGAGQAASATVREARRMLVWWILPLLVMFVAGTILTLDALRMAGLVWIGLMCVAWLPWRMAQTIRVQGPGIGFLIPTLVQALIGIACLVAAVLAGGALVSPRA